MTQSANSKSRVFQKYLPQLGAVKPANIISKKVKKLQKPMTLEKFRANLNSIEEYISSSQIDADEFDKFEEIQNFNFLKLNLLNSTIKTSNNTLENAPKLTALDLDKASEEHDNILAKHQNINFDLQFNQWGLELSLGFNLVFYGIGSKLRVLNEFSDNLNSQGYHVIIANGNNSTTKLNFKLITQTWLMNIIQTESPPLKLKDQINFILNNYQNEKVLLVIHNLDQLKLTKYQIDSLKNFINLTNVHLICSVDKWDTQLQLANFQNFNFIYHKVTTYLSYRLETKYLSLKEESSKKLSLVGVQHVLNSVSEKAKKMFKLLVSSNDDNDEENNRIGLQYTDLFDKCKHKFLVSTEVQLNSLLKEFIDHGVIVQAQENSNSGAVIHGFLQVPLNKEEIKKLTF